MCDWYPCIGGHCNGRRYTWDYLINNIVIRSKLRLLTTATKHKRISTF